MNALTTVLKVLLVSLVCMGLWDETFGAGCSKYEREALLMFRADLEDPFRWLSSWVGQGDCCTWYGVVCDNFTGHVTELHLGWPSSSEKLGFTGKINPSLLELKYLTYLCLSNNDFQGTPIPSFLGSMSNLTSLYLNEAGFGGVIPHQFGNLTNLKQLGLEAADYVVYADSLQWLSGLHSLNYLDLSSVDLSKASNWLEMINTLPSLSTLYLSNCQIQHSLPLVNVNLSSSLSVLDLYHNKFGQTSIITSWVSHLKGLTYLNLGNNNFGSPIPCELRNLTSLRSLYFDGNHFNHSIPNWLYGLHYLEYLNLRGNKLEGTVSHSIGNLSSLVKLDLSLNPGLEFEMGIPDSFKQFCHLRALFLEYVKVNQSLSEVLDILSECASDSLEVLSMYSSQLFGQLTNRIGKFNRLERLVLDGNFISGPLPVSIGELKSLNYVNLANNQINGTIPASFGLLAELESVDISQNSMQGDVFAEIQFASLTKLGMFLASGNQMVLKDGPNWFPSKGLTILDLDSWYVGPGFPNWLKNMGSLKSLSLSNSGISEPIPDWFWSMSSGFYYTNLSHNQIPGRLPHVISSLVEYDTLFDLSFNSLEGPLASISSNLTLFDMSNNLLSGDLVKFLCFNPTQMRNTQYLSLGGNLLSGNLPDCFSNWRSLKVLRLGNNKFTGSIPKSIGTLSSLKSLHIQNNSLTREIPLSIGKKCSALVTINLSYNQLEGEIPQWGGVSLSRLCILNLRGNRFRGVLPNELCNLQSLQILDLSHNMLSGSLPQCLANLSAMAVPTNDRLSQIYLFFGGGVVYSENQVIVTKGSFAEYSTILNYVRSLDLSCNNLSGVVPWQISDLMGLQYLNLSHNSLSGMIPEGLGKMRALESMDLSVNRLSGVIPGGVASLTFLSHLNLSFNRLSGRIPSSTQLQSFDTSSFVGNKELCGPPLNEGCRNTVGDGFAGNGGVKGDEEYYYAFHCFCALGFGAGFGFSVFIFQYIADEEHTLQRVDHVGHKLCNFLMFVRSPQGTGSDLPGTGIRM